MGSSRDTDVFRAYDLGALRYCVLRIQALEPGHRAERLQAIATECEEIKSLKSTNLAALTDHFPRESEPSHVTVWEFCDGETLDKTLRSGSLPEKEARGILLQLVGFLRLLARDRSTYQLLGQDLRPNRLMLRSGEVRVLGLTVHALRRGATIVGIPSPAGQLGGGTLPEKANVDAVGCGSPEEARARLLRRGRSLSPLAREDDETLACGAGDACHDAGVWMLGLTLHEMLFGRKPNFSAPTPFGCLAGSGALQLPDQPKVTPECREFLSRILHRDNRATLNEVLSDPYVAFAGRKQRS